MKLYLSSVGIPNIPDFKRLFSANKPKIGLVANAWDVAPVKIRRPYIEQTQSQLKESGAAVVAVDLLKSPDISGLDGIWLLGGNTFYLNWVIGQAKLAEQLAKTDEKFIFSGESAGAVVAGTTLHGIEFLDNPSDAPKTLWQGLGLVNFGIIPHWQTPEDQAALQKAFNAMSLHTKVKTLTDDQYIVVI